jgi:DNA-binding response OmpR family regulator
MTLLLIENHADLRNHIEAFLKPLYPLLIAHNGLEALDILSDIIHEIEEDQQNLSSHLPSLIISDVKLPIMDGFQFLNALKSKEYFRKIPVIMLIQDIHISKELKTLRFGMDDYLLKPFVKSELLNRIAQLIKNSQSRKLALEKRVEGHQEEFQATKITKWLKNMETIILNQLIDSSLNLKKLALLTQISEKEIETKLVQEVGLTPSNYIQTIRYRQARFFLELKKYKNLQEVMYQVGLNNLNDFDLYFKKHFGKSATAYLH